MKKNNDINRVEPCASPDVIRGHRAKFVVFDDFYPVHDTEFINSIILPLLKEKENEDEDKESD